MIPGLFGDWRRKVFGDGIVTDLGKATLKEKGEGSPRRGEPIACAVCAETMEFFISHTSPGKEDIGSRRARRGCGLAEGL